MHFYIRMYAVVEFRTDFRWHPQNMAAFDCKVHNNFWSVGLRLGPR